MFLVRSGTAAGVKLCCELTYIQTSSDCDNENVFHGIAQYLFILLVV